MCGRLEFMECFNKGVKCIFIVFQPLFKGGKSFPPVSPKESQSGENNLFVIGQANQQLHQNLLQAHHKSLSSPSPDFSVSPSSSSTSNHSNIPPQNKDSSLR